MSALCETFACSQVNPASFLKQAKAGCHVRKEERNLNDSFFFRPNYAADPHLSAAVLGNEGP